MLEEKSLDRVKPEFMGIWPGIVVDNKDPLKKGRLQIRVPQIFGDTSVAFKIADSDLPWAWPCFPYVGSASGLLMVPEIGSGVWVSFYMGDTRSPVWLGGWFSTSDDASEHSGGYAPDPKVYLIKTPSGHKIVMTERPGESGIFIIDKLGQFYKINSDLLSIEMNCLGEHRETVAMSRAESIGLDHTKTVSGAMTYTVGPGGIMMNTTGLLTLTSVLAMILSATALMTLSAVVGITLTSIGVISILSTVVTLGVAASAQKILNKTMMDLYNSHTHLYNPGSGGATQTGSPVQQASEGVHTTQHLKAS